MSLPTVLQKTTSVKFFLGSLFPRETGVRLCRHTPSLEDTLLPCFDATEGKSAPNRVFQVKPDGYCPLMSHKWNKFLLICWQDCQFWVLGVAPSERPWVVGRKNICVKTFCCEAAKQIVTVALYVPFCSPMSILGDTKGVVFSSGVSPLIDTSHLNQLILKSQVHISSSLARKRHGGFHVVDKWSPCGFIQKVEMWPWIVCLLFQIAWRANICILRPQMLFVVWC